MRIRPGSLLQPDWPEKESERNLTVLGEGINLIPEEYGITQGDKTRSRWIGFYCVLVLLTLGLVLVGTFFYRRQVGTDWALVNSQIESQKDIINQEENVQIEGRLRLVKEKAQYLGEFFAARQEYSSFVQELIDRFPSGVSMVSLEQANPKGEFSFRGQAGGTRQVDSFIDKLESWELIESVVLQACDFEVEDSRVVFSLLIKQVE